MKNSCRYKKPYFQAAMLAFFIMLILTRSAQAADFVDTKKNWGRLEISQLQAVDILQGYPDGRFYPEQPISRAEFAKMLVAALGEKEAASELGKAAPVFADIPTAYWANGYIMAGVERGWLQGQGTVFTPEAFITRQEAALVLSRIQATEELQNALEVLDFTDADSIADWAAEGIKQAVQQGLVTGFPDGSFRPEAQLSRAEAVHLFHEIMKQQGRLFDFSGIVKQADAKSLTIPVAGKDRVFSLADEAQIFDRNNLVAALSDLLPARINFNVNSSGELSFGQISYENEYLDLSVQQLETPNLQEEAAVSQSDSPVAPVSLDIQVADEQGVSLAEPPSKTQPALSLGVAQYISGIKTLQTEKAVSGQGVTIAIVDSGIDPLQQDLQRTQDGQRKVVDWVNFSDEGRVDTNLVASAITGEDLIKTSRGFVTLPGSDQSLSGQYHYGFWSEDWIAYSLDFDFNGNQNKEDQIMVLVVDTKTAGVYDQVYVDTNQNFSMADELPLRVFRDNKYNYASFPASADLKQGFPFVLCDVGAYGNEVSFGYDSEGHGTHVAGIAAANGVLQGVAPNAQLMALKVADSGGIAYLEDTLQAVEYAVRKGADIINISLGYYEQDEPAIEAFRARINELAAHTLICVAGGNAGPGLSTLAVPADAPNTLSVGAYIAPQMWATDYGWTTASAGLWYFNSVGPAGDGSLKPDLLAPGSAVSTYPVWTGKTYMLNEGSSMAAPFVAGTAALLMEEMWKQGHGFNSLMIKQALVNGARPLEALSAVEQGHGVLDAYEAAQLVIQEEGLANDSEVIISSQLFGDGSGLLARESIPGSVSFEIQNRAEEAHITWHSETDWLQIENNPEFLPDNGRRTLQLAYDLPGQPGLYTGLIEGTFDDSNRAPLQLMNTVAVPENWSKNGEFTKYDSLSAGQIKRSFLEVPQGEESLVFKLRILGSLNNLQGRARMHIFDTKGQLYTVSEYAGLAPDGLASSREVTVTIDLPIAGIWEVVVYSSSTLSQYERTESDYIFNAKLAQLPEAPKYVTGEFIIGSTYPRSEDGKTNIQLTILNVSDNSPYDGLLQINDRLYYVDQGKVCINLDIQRQAINIIVKRVTLKQ